MNYCRRTGKTERMRMFYFIFLFILQFIKIVFMNVFFSVIYSLSNGVQHITMTLAA